MNGEERARRGNGKYFTSEALLMTPTPKRASHHEQAGISRHTVLGSSIAAASAGVIAHGVPAAVDAGTGSTSKTLRGSDRTYGMKKSINLWAFPYPGPDVVARLPQAGQGRRLRRDRAELRPRQRPVARRPAPATSARSANRPTRSASPSAASARSSTGPISLTDNDPAAGARGSSWPAR